MKPLLSPCDKHFLFLVRNSSVGMGRGCSLLGTRKNGGRRVQGRTSSSMGAALGNLVGGSPTGPCEGSGDGNLSRWGPR